ncbi:hypothetical protein V6N12_045582 [Hibiscus sabdariffa]|uniref:Uncharacterized protein n=1 Tax=Hibiscus sabdariffa TaxID=183260 RepID=A0ABR2G4A2_9ROSI
MRIVLKHERKQYVIEEHVPNEPGANAPRADKDMFKKHLDDMIDVGCLMLATMTPELQKQHEDMVAYEMIHNLKEIYEGQARQERYETSKALFQCKMIEGSPVGAHVFKMMGYIQTLEKLGFSLKDELATDLILQSFLDSFKPFVLNFNMNEINKTLPQLLGMLRTAEGDMKNSGSKSILVVREAKGKRKKVVKSKGIGKMTKAPFSGKGERASDLLGLIHSDVCGPMNTQARGGFQYFITFTDDFSRYGYIYLMRHKSEALEKFKEFKNEVQNQHGKSIKALRSDR